VTVGTGVDLGQMDVKEYTARLQKAGASPELIDKLKPYIGLKRGEACAYLRDNPLTITKEEADLLDREMKNHHLSGTIREFDAAAKKAGSATTFTSLSAEQQTVVFSRKYRLGSLTVASNTDLVSSALAGNTESLLDALYANQARDPTRTMNEMNLIQPGSFDARVPKKKDGKG
jgi:hypothetical protein